MPHSYPGRSALGDTPHQHFMARPINPLIRRGLTLLPGALRTAAQWPLNCLRLLYMCLAVPGKILETTDLGISRIGKVEFGGVSRQIQLDFVPEARVGDYVLVHVGFAISKIEEDEARRTYEVLRQLAEEMPPETSE